jgi:hypothetical protein
VRPLTQEQVLAKIRELSARNAPGLEAAVVNVQTSIARGALEPATCREWIASFFPAGA